MTGDGHQCPVASHQQRSVGMTERREAELCGGAVTDVQAAFERHGPDGASSAPRDPSVTDHEPERDRDRYRGPDHAPASGSSRNLR